MIKYNKAEGNSSFIIKIMVILGILTICFIVWGLVLLDSNSIEINDNKFKIEVISKKIVEECFEQKSPGLIEDNKFNQNNLDSCLNGVDENIVLLVSIPQEKSLYLRSMREEFESTLDLCFSGSTTVCNQFIFPIIYVENEQNMNRQLIVQVLIS